MGWPVVLTIFAIKLKYLIFEGWVFSCFHGQNKYKVRGSVIKLLNNIKVRKLYIFASKCSFLVQNRLKTHIESWVALKMGSYIINSLTW